jgi:hypothetical protein
MMDIVMSSAYAQCGTGTLPGVVQRPDDPLKHLGPIAELGVDMKSTLFLTRCGLISNDGSWFVPDDDVDMWCLDCIRQGNTPVAPFLIVSASGDS